MPQITSRIKLVRGLGFDPALIARKSTRCGRSAISERISRGTSPRALLSSPSDQPTLNLSWFIKNLYYRPKHGSI